MKNLLLLPLLALTVACTQTHRTSIEDNAAFWERTDAVSALYMRGPKAQHTLHKDIASCVSEVKELSRLGTIRDANPPRNIEMNVGLAHNWQSPRGDGPTHTEFRDFHDFESCMNFKGWNRVNYVTPTAMQTGKTNYKTVILGDQFGSKPKSPNYAQQDKTDFND
jgi:hypothetical protein